MRAMFVAMVVVLLAVIGCAQTAVEDSAEIRGRAESWEMALNSGDIDSLVDLYTDDARMLAPNSGIQQGKDAVRAVFGGMIDAGLGGSTETVSAVTSGDVGYHIGTYEVTAADGTVVDQGKFIETWRKIDGDWKMSADMFASSLPAAGPQGETFVAIHSVKDGAHWLAAWQAEDGRRTQFADHGVAGAQTLQSVDDPNLTGVILDIVDMEAFQALLASEEGAAAMDEDGLEQETMKFFAEVQ